MSLLDFVIIPTGVAIRRHQTAWDAINRDPTIGRNILSGEFASAVASIAVEWASQSTVSCEPTLSMTDEDIMMSLMEFMHENSILTETHCADQTIDALYRAVPDLVRTIFYYVKLILESPQPRQVHVSDIGLTRWQGSDMILSVGRFSTQTSSRRFS